MIRYLSHRFAHLGFEVETAADGLVGLVMAGRRAPDLLITDVRMPKVDGLSLTRTLVRNGGARMVTIVISDRCCRCSVSDTVSDSIL